MISRILSRFPPETPFHLYWNPLFMAPKFVSETKNLIQQ